MFVEVNGGPVVTDTAIVVDQCTVSNNTAGRASLWAAISADVVVGCNISVLDTVVENNTARWVRRRQSLCLRKECSCAATTQCARG